MMSMSYYYSKFKSPNFHMPKYDYKFQIAKYFAGRLGKYVLCGAVIIISIPLFTYFWRRRRRWRLYNSIKKRQIERKHVIEEIQNSLDAQPDEKIQKRQEIRSLSLQELLDSIQRGDFCAFDVVQAWQEKAIEAHEKTNAVALFIKEAERWARDLDEAAKEKNYKKPPLFGMPFTIKECVTLKGYDQTLGLAQLIDKMASVDSVLASVLRAQGAIPIALTNLPQLLFGYSCTNPIYGITINPYNPKRTCGGSSGGEAALIASGGSLVGFGTDIAGSIRIPCHFCGIVGLKPCARRLSNQGIPSRPVINAIPGPLAYDVDTIVTIMRHLLKVNDDNCMSSFDPYTVPIQFNDLIYDSSAPLTVGYYDFDGYCETTPACSRALHIAKETLEKLGHHLIPWQPPNVPYALSLFFAAINMDGDSQMAKAFSSDIIDESLATTAMSMRMPMWLQKLLTMFPGMERIRTIIHRFPSNINDLHQVYAEIETYRQTFFLKWTEAKLDALICPALAVPAVPHDFPIKVPLVLSHTILYNLLDYPAGVVPITRVTAQDELEIIHYRKRDMWSHLIAKATEKDTLDLPVGIQCISLPFKEEMALRLMKELEINVEFQTKNDSRSEIL